MNTEETTVKSSSEYDLTRLQTIVDNFKLTKTWEVMKATVENSPWHREANVAVHTEMTIEAAQKHFPDLSTAENDYLRRRHIVLVTLALLFHDTGKPVAEVTKTSEERGVYRSYAGHEQSSARVFESYAIDNWAQFGKLINQWDVYVITWMIEHHLPYGLKQKDKVEALDKSLALMFEPNTPEVFFNMLMGDTGGRISDAYETNYSNMMSWISERRAAVAEITPKVANDCIRAESLFEYTDVPVMMMLIGPSGAGKSTIRNSLTSTVPSTWTVLSLDDMRMEFAKGNVPVVKGIGPIADKETYRLAYAYYAENEAEFGVFAQRKINEAFKSGKSVMVDNTNTGAKRRRQYLALAKQHDMVTVAFYVPSSLDVVLARQTSREDKFVPPESVIQQYNSIALPSLGGEFDIVRLASHNFAA